MHTLIRVVVADDHPLVRLGICTALQGQAGLEVVGQAADGEQVRRICVEQKPDVLLLDLQMPGPPPLETVAYLRAQAPQLRVIVLTAYDDQTYVRAMVAAGVAGYILKEEADATVVRAIRAVADGDRWLSASALASLAEPPAASSDPVLAALTERERELLRLIGLGWDNVRIARELNLAEQTVRNYISRLYVAIGVRTRAEAVVWARKRGLGGSPEA